MLTKLMQCDRCFKVFQVESDSVKDCDLFCPNRMTRCCTGFLVSFTPDFIDALKVEELKKRKED